MADYADIQLRILAPAAENGSATSYPVEATWNGEGPWRGVSELDFAKLDPGNMPERDYGIALGKALLNPQVENCLSQARVSAGRPSRIRLLLDAEEAVPHNVRWERMHLTVGKAAWPVAMSPSVAFSRYVSVQMPDAEPSDEPAFRLLLAVANPTGLPENEIDVEKEIAALVEEFEIDTIPPRLKVVVLPGRSPLSVELRKRIAALGWEMEAGSTTLERVATVLDRKRCQGLHILCHGEFRANRSVGLLYLESETGASQGAQDIELRAWVRPEMKLAVFQSCRTAAAAPLGEPPFVGVAHRMVGLGVPAVIAMQDYVGMDDARAFVSGFYRRLLQDGLVDVATNAGRAAMGARGGDWSIPALFLRLRSALIVNADPIREAVLASRRSMAEDGKLPDTMPLRVVDHLRGMDYEPGRSPEGSELNLGSALLPLISANPAMGLTGAPGSNKTEHSQLLYCMLADQFLENPSSHAPIWLCISNLAAWGMGQAGNGASNSQQPRLVRDLESLARGGRAPEYLAARRFRLVVQVDEELSPAQFDVAFRTLDRIQRELPDAHSLFSFDDTQIQFVRGFVPDGKLLVAKPMDLTAVRAYLLGTGEPSDEELAHAIESRSLGDLASVPWLLAEMQILKRMGYPFESRAQVLKLVTDRFLGAFPAAKIPRSVVKEALMQAAWTLQSARERVMDPPELWETLETARAGREFDLTELRDGLSRTHILAPAREEGIRFSYPGIQAYFAALALLNSPRFEADLEDITATLGRYSRLQHWQDTLVILAGMLDSNAERERLLRIILAGSSMVEGNQVLLAARLYTEMRTGATKSTTSKTLNLEQSRVVQQMVATLTWRSRPDIPRAYQDRRRAVEALVAMGHPDSVPFLTRMVFDRFPSLLPVRDTDVEPRDGRQRSAFDASGTRMVAAAGLLRMAELTEDYFKANRPELLTILQAWKNYLLDGNEDLLLSILAMNDPSLSPVAAFAYAYRKQALEPNHPLMAAFWNDDTHPEVKWAITDLFGVLDPVWLTETVVVPWLERKPRPTSRLCYLIQKSRHAPPGSLQYDYLQRSMRNNRTVHRALRALAKVSEREVAEQVRDLCHWIVRKDWHAAMASGGLPLRKAPSPSVAWRLEHSALEALRDVGDLKSIDVLQDSRLETESVLALLSFQVAEEIYWRVSGGQQIERF